MTDLVLTERDTKEGLLVSVCDADVIGDTFENGQISLTVTEEFYAPDNAEIGVTEERVVDRLAACATANLVGTRTVTLAVEHGFVDEEHVLELPGTRHAQYLRLG